MKNKILIALAALLSIAAADVVKKQIELPRARITARVVDEQSTPLAGVHVKFIFGTSDSANSIVKVEGVTADDGLFSGEGYSRGSYGADIRKDGYYNSGLGAPKLIDIKDSRWEPWDPQVTAILRPIGRPIAMHAKNAWINIPTVDQPCGYDLEKGDWVAPHGKGVTADLVFKLARRYVSQLDFDASVNVSFSNPRDGIQEAQLPDIGRYSLYRWPREAPDDGYAQLLAINSSRNTNGHATETAKEQQAYFFRVRTVEQNGTIISALYGKIRGGLFLSPMDSKTCKVRLTYYLNPTSLDRNMEWDPKRNLIAGLSWEENPREP